MKFSIDPKISAKYSSSAKESLLPSLFSSLSWETKDTLSYQLKQIIFQTVKETVGEKTKVQFEDVRLEHPSNENYGDYSANIAMVLAGRLKIKPVELATKLKDRIEEYIRRYQTITVDYTIHPSDLLEKVKVAGPGFINLWLRKDYLISQMQRVLESENAGIASQTGKGKKIVIEHTSPNSIKMLHVGHIRNNILGMSIGLVLKALGFGVVWDAINNDRGIHICKAMWAYLIYGQKARDKPLSFLGLWQKRLSEWSSSPENWHKPSDRNMKSDHFVDEYYVLGVKAEKEVAGSKEEMQEILRFWEKEETQVRSLWKTLTDWVHEGFGETYRRLGSIHDKNWYESKLYKEGKELIKEGLAKGAFRRLPDGAILTNLSDYGLSDGVTIRSDGTALYFTFDPNLTKHKREKFHADLYIWDIGSEQTLYLKQLFAVCEKLGIGKRDDYYHLSYGFVFLAGKGKMSSRAGTVISADSLLDQMHQKARKIIEESKGELRGDLTEEEKEKIAEIVGTGALKYGLLKVSRLQDIYFDIDKSLALEGDSGPYLMYTYARCRSVLRKSRQDTPGVARRDSPGVEESEEPLRHTGSVRSTLPVWRGLEPNPEELSLLRSLYRFPEAVVEAARTFSPNLLCSFLFDLAQKYNLFYDKHSILNPAPKTPLEESIRNFRLSLTSATAISLKKGLYLLGIETVERM